MALLTQWIKTNKIKAAHGPVPLRFGGQINFGDGLSTVMQVPEEDWVS